ncbi:MAG: neutral/alkaline non-lysosomal ceramidase N-terminal domain-containing protein, partial [Clostridia bacterium]|nr:neutral/alkaline non-lysosomal ceramidase N-terminal domain-containing protein [Clostridia bacterium]
KKAFTNVPVYIASLIRLVVLPAVAIGVLYLTKLEYALALCVVCNLAMPLGLSPVVVPAGYGKDTSAAAGMALISHLLSCGTIPLMFWLFSLIVNRGGNCNMKKLFALFLCACMILSLVAGGGSDGADAVTVVNTTGNAENTDTQIAGGVFMAGFGRVDITPKESVPMASYGDDRERLSTGLYSYLEARAVVVQDAEGGMLVFLTGDVSWAPNRLATPVRAQLASKLGIPESNIIVSGTHTHSSVSTSLADMPAVGRFNEQYIQGMVKAATDAVADLKPAEVYVGSVMTENMNFVRRYFMDDGSLDGDNAYGTGTKRVAHETEADGELQLMKFVREGGKDILVSNFQAHPHLEGKTTNLSAQTVGTIRDEVEKRFNAHALHWQGAAGNVNSASSLEGETRTTDRVEYGKIMGDYIETVYNDLTKVETGPVQVRDVTHTAEVNHMYDHMVNQAQDVVTYFNSGHTASQTATYAHQYKDGNGLRINSYYHANRILENSRLGAPQDMYLLAWSFG